MQKPLANDKSENTAPMQHLAAGNLMEIKKIFWGSTAAACSPRGRLPVDARHAGLEGGADPAEHRHRHLPQIPHEALLGRRPAPDARNTRRLLSQKEVRVVFYHF